MVGESGRAQRTVVVTGCSSGIGAAACARLLAADVRVIGLDIREPDGGEHEFVPVDIADVASVERAAESLPDRVDALINAAGVSSGIGDPSRVVAINILGLRQLTELLVPRMAGEGYIVNASSLAAAGWREHRDMARDFLAITDREKAMQWCLDHPDDVGAGYSFSKETVVVYTASRAFDLATRGIRINATAPGVTETPILDDSIARLGAEYLDTIPKPLGRLATADEQARVMVFLAGDGASYISGQTVWVDGGYTAAVDAGEIETFGLNR